MKRRAYERLDPLLLFTIRAHPAGGEVKMSTQAVGFFFSSLALRSAPWGPARRGIARGVRGAEWASGASPRSAERGATAGLSRRRVQRARRSASRSAFASRRKRARSLASHSAGAANAARGVAVVRGCGVVGGRFARVASARLSMHAAQRREGSGGIGRGQSAAPPAPRQQSAGSARRTCVLGWGGEARGKAERNILRWTAASSSVSCSLPPLYPLPDRFSSTGPGTLVLRIVLACS